MKRRAPTTQSRFFERRVLWCAVAPAGLLLLAGFLSSGSGVADGAERSSGTSAGSWTVYHGDPSGSGSSSEVSSVDTTSPTWTSSELDGELFGEPLAWSGQVYVATENDTVYALSSMTGAVTWARHLASPVPSGDLPCGDITPTVGITGTPVIDPSRNELFVVAEELVNARPVHLLVGLNTANGTTELTQDVDPSGATPSALLQRTALSLDDGQVVFGMGGNYGDCASYRGRVIAVEESGGTPKVFTVDDARGDSQGAVWMGGAAPAIDSNGDIWVSAGNGSVNSSADAYDDSDSALELSSSLNLLQYFAPTNWPENNAQDLDMSTAPALLADGQVVLAGKSRIVYLLDGARLGGIGSEEASVNSGCGDDIDGGTAVVGTTVFLPCLAGIIAVKANQSPNSLTQLWNSGTGGGPPIVAAGLVWTIGQNGTLYGLNAATGKVQQRASIGVPANHFPTPSVGDGLLLATSSDRVIAFAAQIASASSTTTSTSMGATSSTHAISAPTSKSGSTRDGAVVAVLVAAGLIVVGGAAYFVRSRRKARYAR